jgi:hypothetical protein
MSFVVGSTASKRAGGIGAEGNTVISLNNPSTAAGTMTVAEMYFSTGDADGSGVKVGLFYLTTTSTMSYKCRSSATISGTVTKGSAQSKSVSLTVASGDYIGYHCDDGQMERDTSGGAGLLWVAGDQCTAGTEATYALLADDIASINGTCSTGWATISKVMGGASVNITKVMGGSVANITKVMGGAV